MTTSDDAKWKPCPAGTLPRFAKQQRTRVFRRQLLQASGVASVLVLVGGVSYLKFFRSAPGPIAEPRYGGVTCTEVRTNARGYLAGSLEPKRMWQFQKHIEECDRCQAAFREMSEATTSAVGDSPMEMGQKLATEERRKTLRVEMDQRSQEIGSLS